MASISGAPSTQVLAAFGVRGRAQPLAGGQGRTWRAGEVVLKPTGLPAETAWRAKVLAGLPESAQFRVARPVRAADGGWTAFGWEAWQAVAGEPDPTRAEEILRAGEAFHGALAGVTRPAFLDARDDPWTFGERVAWEGLAIEGDPRWVALLEPLAQARRPVDLAAQPVHGDLPGNVLFAEGLPPAVIDWPVYFRPPSWASAVAVADLLTWYGAPATLLDSGAGVPEWDQMLVRALMYRIATNEGCRRHGLPVRERPEDYRATVDLVLARLRGGQR